MAARGIARNRQLHHHALIAPALILELALDVALWLDYFGWQGLVGAVREPLVAQIHVPPLPLLLSKSEPPFSLLFCIRCTLLLVAIARHLV